MNRPVAQRSEPILHQRLPLIGFDSPRKNIGVKSRRADHREDSTGVNVKSNDGSFLTLEGFEGGLLKLAVQRQVNCVAGNLHLLTTALAAKEVLPGFFQTVLSKLVAGRVTLVL